MLKIEERMIKKLLKLLLMTAVMFLASVNNTAAVPDGEVGIVWLDYGRWESQAELEDGSISYSSGDQIKIHVVTPVYEETIRRLVPVEGAKVLVQHTATRLRPTFCITDVEGKCSINISNKVRRRPRPGQVLYRYLHVMNIVHSDYGYTPIRGHDYININEVEANYD